MFLLSMSKFHFIPSLLSFFFYYYFITKSYWTLPNSFSVSIEVATWVLPSILFTWCVLLIQKLLFLSGFSFWVCVLVGLCYRPRYALILADFNCQLYDLHMLFTVSKLMWYNSSKAVNLDSGTNHIFQCLFVIVNKENIFSSCWQVYQFLLWLKIWGEKGIINQLFSKCCESNISSGY